MPEELSQNLKTQGDREKGPLQPLSEPPRTSPEPPQNLPRTSSEPPENLDLRFNHTGLMRLQGKPEKESAHLVQLIWSSRSSRSGPACSSPEPTAAPPRASSTSPLMLLSGPTASQRGAKWTRGPEPRALNNSALYFGRFHGAEGPDNRSDSSSRPPHRLLLQTSSQAPPHLHTRRSFYSN